MNNPISDLYIKFMENADPYLRRYPYLREHFNMIINDN